MSTIRLAGGLVAMALFTACNNGPKAIPEDANGADAQSSTGVFSGGASNAPSGAVDPAAKEDLHTVLALEALPTSKYVYVRVREGSDEFWIATTLQEVALGRSYFYRGGLLKTDFVSKEYNRTFDRLYLVTQLVPSDHGSGMAAQAPAVAAAPVEGAPLPKVDVPGSTRIADIIGDAKRFAGKTIQVSGTCTKVNPNIMGRNWVHIKDKSKGDPELVITTDAPVAEGQAVTMIGTVAVDKDFGAGYRYAVLLEGGRLVK
ncbi:MAG TPA: GW dipeptide domain-containing protein [Flavobacteriales bacterium]|nr:GW dipeptide domain-containing protein [Flavobacteriales bacterium]